MLSFDLRTATISYTPGFNASITYTPEADTYEVFFFRHGEAKDSPHEMLANLLSQRLNELSSAAQRTGRSGSGISRVGREFIGVSKHAFCHSRRSDSLVSCCEILCRSCLRSRRSVPPFRASFQSSLCDQSRDTALCGMLGRLVGPFAFVDAPCQLIISRYAVDVTLLPSDQYLIFDGARPQPDGTIDFSCGTLTSIPKFPLAIHTALWAIRISESGRDKGDRGVPSVLKLDHGTSLLCSVSVIGEVVRCLVSEVESGLGGEPPTVKSEI